MIFGFACATGTNNKIATLADITVRSTYHPSLFISSLLGLVGQQLALLNSSATIGPDLGRRGEVDEVHRSVDQEAG